MKDEMCTGCGRWRGIPLGLNEKGEKYLACCPDNHYVPMTPNTAEYVKHIQLKLEKYRSFIQSSKNNYGLRFKKSAEKVLGGKE